MHVVLAVLVLSGPLVLSSCRRPTGGTSGTDGGDTAGGDSGSGGPAPSVLVRGSGDAMSLAVGPFVNLRTSGATEEGLFWGWGDVSSESQIYFTLAPGGSLRSSEIPVADQLATAIPLPGGRGCVGVHYADFTAWYHPFEGDPVSLGQAHGLDLSPSGSKLLVYAGDRVSCFDTTTWASTPQPEIPSFEFPYSGANVTWIDDTLVAVRFWEPAGGPLGLDPDTGIIKLVSQPDGAVVGVLESENDILAPFPSPDGMWLAVLHIDGPTAVTPPEGVYPVDVGLQISVYARSALSSPEPAPAAVLRPGEGKLMTGLVWSPDSRMLAYAEASVFPAHPDEFPLAAGARQVSVARAPGFEAETRSPGDGDFTPLSFSPASSTLALADRETNTVCLWDLASFGGIRAPETVATYDLAWLSENLLCGRLETGDGPGRPVLIRASTTAEVIDLGWPGSWRWVTGGMLVAMTTHVEAGGSLELFGEVPEGDWLVVYPALVSQ
ncbi:MAG: hypothetical protein C4551_00465 [Bacillota bacterium]|nr:MAG: hypothetical protein C4551_00465 [Bacillota bacterium]